MALLETLVDNFATQDAAKWDWTGAQLVGGTAQIPIDHDYTGGLASIAEYDLRGSSVFAEVVERAKYDTITSTGAGVGLGSGVGGDVGFNFIGDRIHALYNLKEPAPNDGDVVVQDSSYNATNHRWVRIAESGGAVTWSTSPDGINWTTFAIWEHGGRDYSAVTFYTWGGFWDAAEVDLPGGDPGVFRIDNVNVPGGVVPPPIRESIDLTLVSATPWVNGTTSVLPTYPAGAVIDTDILAVIIHSKPDTVTPATPNNWTNVGSFVGGAGAQGPGVGLTRMTVFTRPVVGSAPPGGAAATFNVAGGNVASACMRLYRVSDPTRTARQFEIAAAAYSDATEDTTQAGSTGVIELKAKDKLLVAIGSPDDATTTLTVTGVTQPGSTIGGLARNPNVTQVSATGNQLATTAYDAAVTAGGANAAVAVAGTGNVAETGMGVVLRMRATADYIPPPPGGPEPGRMLLAV